MSVNEKSGARGAFNQLSENIKSGLIFGAVLLVICMVALWLR